jgi:hypothetical protein
VSAQTTSEFRAEIRRLAAAIDANEALTADDRAQVAFILFDVATLGLRGWLPKESTSKKSRWQFAVAFIDARYEFELRARATVSLEAKKLHREKNRTPELAKALGCSTDKIERARTAKGHGFRHAFRSPRIPPDRFLGEALKMLPAKQRREVGKLFSQIP